MTKKTTTLKERLAALATEFGDQENLQPDQLYIGGDDRPKRRFSFRRGFLLPAVLVPMLVTFQLNDDLFVVFAKLVAETEIAGKTNIATVLASDSLSGGDLAVVSAVKQAKHRLANEDLNLKEENSLRAFIRYYEGKTSADLSRKRMILELTGRARQMGDEPMARMIEAQLNACRSVLCLETVYSKVAMELDILSQ